MPAIQPAAQPINAPTELTLNALHQRGGVASGAELQADLRVSQPTVSCALAPLLHTGRVRKVGAVRSLRCPVSRAVPGAGVQVPVVCIDAQGQPQAFGQRTPLPSGAVWVDEVHGLRATGQRHGGLPWFLNNTGPQGFMGRTFAAAHPDLKLGINPAKWTGDEVLRAMAFYGDDLPGNLVAREAAFERFHTLTQHAPGPVKSCRVTWRPAPCNPRRPRWATGHAPKRWLWRSGPLPLPLLPSPTHAFPARFSALRCKILIKSVSSPGIYCLVSYH